MQKQQSSSYQNISGFNMGDGGYGPLGEVPLPLPSKNSVRGKKIISTLMLESEALTLNTQFNYRPTNDVTEKSPGLRRSNTVVKYEVRDLSSVNKGEFESKLLGSPNIGVTDQMNCATMFDKQYLILGNDVGLSVMDFSVRREFMKRKQLMCGCSFKKLQVLDDYGVMIAIAGKKQTIRIYKLDSLMHLIKFIINSKSGGTPVDFSKAPALLKKMTDSLPRCETCGHRLDENRAGDRVCSNYKCTRENSDSNTDESSVSQSSTCVSSRKLHHRQLSNISMHYIQHHLSNSIDNADISAEEKSTIWHWATDYVKLPEAAKGCVSFDIKETKSYLYLTVVTINHSILLFSCPVESKYKNDCKFESLNSYFVPTTPSFISVSTDSFIIKQIIAGMEDGKAVVIDCHTSIVTELSLTKNLIPRDVESPKWVSFTPVPRSCPLDFILANPEPSKVIISLTPDAPQASMLRRSSYSSSRPEKKHSRSQSATQNLIPSPTSPTEGHFPLKDEKSDGRLRQKTVPPLLPKKIDGNSRQTPVISVPPSASSQNSVEPSQTAEVERLSSENTFLCTVSKVSHLVNIRAEPYPHSRPIHWTSEPNHISLLPTIDDVLVIAFENQLVEVGSMKTGKIVKTAASGSPIKYLGESRRKHVPSKGYEPKKDKINEGITRYVFWSCEMGNDTYIYRGSIF